jgi:hypothetical protein
MMSGAHLVGVVEALATLQGDMFELATNLTLGTPSFLTFVVDVVVVMMNAIPATAVATTLTMSSALRGQRAKRAAAERTATLVVVATC